MHSTPYIETSTGTGIWAVPLIGQTAEGVQQGDPLGPLLFCFTIHSLFSQLVSELNQKGVTIEKPVIICINPDIKDSFPPGVQSAMCPLSLKRSQRLDIQSIMHFVPCDYLASTAASDDLVRHIVPSHLHETPFPIETKK